MYDYIVNPETKRNVSIHGKAGRNVLRNYVQRAGGERYDIIVNPETKRNVSIHGKAGRKVLRNYVQRAEGGASRVPQKAKGPLVWIGELGDIRQTKDGQVFAWATVDKTLVGKSVDFIPNEYQSMPQQAKGSPKGHSRVLQAYTRAIKKYDKALALDPSNKIAHYSKGVALLKLGNENESGDQVAESMWHFDKASKGDSPSPKKALPSKGDSPSPKKALPSKGDVWIGELGDVRETKEGQVVAWATVDNTLFGKHVDFIPNAYQPRPG